MEKAATQKKKGPGGGTRTIKNASTQVVYKRNKKEENKEENEQKPKKPPTNSMKNSHGQKIGKDINDDRWQCKICSFKNPPENDFCLTCDSQKGETRPKH